MTEETTVVLTTENYEFHRRFQCYGAFTNKELIKNYTYIHNHCVLTPNGRILLQKIIVSRLVDKFTAFQGNICFIYGVHKIQLPTPPETFGNTFSANKSRHVNHQS
jgi:hypothetical protein